MEKTQKPASVEGDAATFTDNKTLFAAILEGKEERLNGDGVITPTPAVYAGAVATARVLSTPMERSVRRRQSRTGNGYSAS